MSRWQHVLIAALALTLLAGCVAPPPMTGEDTITAPPVEEQAPPTTVGPTETPPADPTPLPSPPDQDPLQVISLYASQESPGEETAGLGHYFIVAQEFSQDHIFVAGSQSEAAFSLEDVLPVVALGRKVADTTSPPPLSDQDESTPWRLYIRGNEDQSEISCSPETGFFWQEVFAILNPILNYQDISTYSLPITQICYMPPNTTTELLGQYTEDDQVWIDAAVFDLGDEGFGLYRFGPPEPGPPSGPRACQNVCAPISCRSAIGCFVYRVCRTVCR